MCKLIEKHVVNDPDMPRESKTVEGPLTEAQILFISALTGNVHPIRNDIDYTLTTRAEKPIAHGLMRKNALFKFFAAAALRP